MSWRDRLTTIDGESVYAGKFRNALFLVRSDDLEFGRKSELHEYPLRDLPYVEDSGRKTRQFRLTVFVAGDNYDIDRNKLIEAIEQPGAGTLQHPFYGTMQVSIVDARIGQNTRKAGLAEFTLTCVVGGELAFPTSAVDTPRKVREQAEKTLADSIADFSANFDVIGQAADAVQSVIDEVDATLGAVDDAIGNVTGPVSDLIRSPAEMASAIVGSINQIRITLGEPGRALNIYKDLFSAGSTTAEPTTTTSQKKTARNKQALQHLVQRAAMTEAAITTAGRSYATTDDALADADAIATAIDAHTAAEDVVSGQPIDDSVYTSLIDLRAAVVRDLRERGAQLPKLTSHMPAATLPALVIAYQLYGDASRADEIVTRNRIRHPGFVRGGEPLEVLNV